MMNNLTIEWRERGRVVFARSILTNLIEKLKRGGEKQDTLCLGGNLVSRLVSTWSKEAN